MSSQEIITFQVGTYSNFVGTHYWNAQKNQSTTNQENEDYDVSKLFRESMTTNSCVPRLISFDLKSSLKTLREDGSFNDDNQNIDAENHHVYAQPLFERNEFMTQVFADQRNEKVYNLDNKVSTWSDFMTNRLHENSLQLLTQNFDDGKEFMYFGLGQQEYKKMWYDVDDKIHFWAEECNSLEGFQIFADIHNGFSGISSSLLENVYEEYTKKCSLAYINWPIHSITKQESVYEDLNAALTIQSYREHCSLFVLQSLQKDLFCQEPTNVILPNINYKMELPYHTSAILAATIDSTTLPWRKHNRTLTLADMCNLISQNKWKLAGSSFGVNYFPCHETATLFEKLYGVNQFYGPLLTNLSPSVNICSNFPTSHSVVLQNISENCVIPNKIESGILQALEINTNIFNVNPMSVLNFFNQRYYPCERTVSNSTYINKEMDTDTPFPLIVKPPDDAATNLPVTSLSSIYTSSCIYNLLRDVITRVQNINLHRHHIIQEFGLDNDLLKELLEDIIHFAQEYDRQRAFDELSIA